MLRIGGRRPQSYELGLGVNLWFFPNASGMCVHAAACFQSLHRFVYHFGSSACCAHRKGEKSAAAIVTCNRNSNCNYCLTNHLATLLTRRDSWLLDMTVQDQRVVGFNWKLVLAHPCCIVTCPLRGRLPAVTGSTGLSGQQRATAPCTFLFTKGAMVSSGSPCTATFGSSSSTSSANMIAAPAIGGSPDTQQSASSGMSQDHSNHPPKKDESRRRSSSDA